MRPTAWHGESYYKSRRMARKERTTKTYFAVADKDRSSAYGLWFPDVPGCFSASDRGEDIVKKVNNLFTSELIVKDINIDSVDRKNHFGPISLVWLLCHAIQVMTKKLL